MVKPMTPIKPMQLEDFPWLSEDILTVDCIDDPKGFKKGEIRLYQSGSHWYVTQDANTKRVEFKKDISSLETLGRRRETLWVYLKRDHNTLYLQYLSVIERIELDLQIGVTEKIAEDLYNKKAIDQANITKACEWLMATFLLPTDGKHRLIIAYFDNATTKATTKQFLAIGNGWQINISRDDQQVSVKSLTRVSKERPALSLIEGKLEFYDAGIAQRLLDPAQQALLGDALRDHGSYLALWKLYSDREWERANQQASELGALRFISRKARDGEKLEWQFFPESAEKFAEFREKWKTLELSGANQVEISKDSPDWGVTELDSPGSSNAYDPTVFRGQLFFERDGTITVSPDEQRKNKSPPDTGYISYSLAGEKAVRRRREQAKEAIDKGRGLPQLAHLLHGVTVPVAPYKKLKALTNYAKQSFKGKPTERQVQALDVALNTPDIALIIGPPGTGKTQVIAALQRRLAEENNGEQIQHQVLISSYQHDAVDNALNRSDVYGLPAIKVGGRANRNNDTPPITFWCDQRREQMAKALDKLHREEPHVALLAELQGLFHELKLSSMAPSVRYQQLGRISGILEQLEVMNIRLPSDIRHDWATYTKPRQADMHVESRNADVELLRRVRALRVTPISFADDGTERAYDLVSFLQRKKMKLELEEQGLLNTAADQSILADESYAQLRTLKNTLLDRFIADYRPPEIRNHLEVEGVAILRRMEDSLRERTAISRKGIAAVVSRYYEALAYSPKETERAVKAYSAIVGATCQQSAGEQMSNLKSLSGLETSTGIQFETVVIDEAARANPLDLFVPMAMARRRIVLVGDDRQLPHLLEPEVEKEIVEQHELTERQSQALKQSLFERLRQQFVEMEKKDGIRRVVMLDTQFRMHPLLGDFISQNFYESEGMGVLKSGRPAEDFVHQLPGYAGKVAAWIDVPLDDGGESRHKTSRIREAEAEVIAREAKRLLDAAGDAASIGVITFYSAQRDLILEKLARLGVVENGEITPEYSRNRHGEERLRVGTVDAFQGKEFDVVLLSIVRASKKVIPTNTETEKREAALNSKYGHLRLSNRINVAMSRQRNLLITVGAIAMANTQEAKEAVPALHNFLTLCGGQHGCIR